MQQQYGTPQAEPVQPLSQQDYIAAREAVIVSEQAAQPKEGDQKREGNNGFTFFEGQWVSWALLPSDHPDYLPF